ncbi:MAG: response regulator transcription factor [Bacteroidales bacterium]|nr:response regulator transcription factor [Bacteroidales bacterium]
MYLRFTREIAGRKFTGSFIAAYLIINILVFTIIAILSEKATIINRTSLIKHVFVLFYIVYTFTGLFYLLSGKKKRPALKKNDIRNLSAVLVIVVIIQSVLIILLYDKSIYFTLLFILIFYLLGIFLPFYLKYFADLSVYLIKEDVTATFDSFCESYEISKREKEIIYEICKGLSNQQIADKLFISLQTVKDHTHRIYFKTNCNSRTQLMRMVNANR